MLPHYFFVSSHITLDLLSVLLSLYSHIHTQKKTFIIHTHTLSICLYLHLVVYVRTVHYRLPYRKTHTYVFLCVYKKKVIYVSSLLLVYSIFATHKFYFFFFFSNFFAFSLIFVTTFHDSATYFYTFIYCDAQIWHKFSIQSQFKTHFSCDNYKKNGFFFPLYICVYILYCNIK